MSVGEGLAAPWRTADFDYELPPQLIAREPAARRSGSRLLDGRQPAAPVDRRFDALPTLLKPGDLLVVNDTRVLKARLEARKDSGGAVQVQIERLLGGREALAHLKASRAPKVGSTLWLGDGGVRATVLGRRHPDGRAGDARDPGGLFHLDLGEDALALLERHGRMPLPPYIEAARQHDGSSALHADDAARYQTVFAERAGAVAAPTASLHFDAELLAALQARGVRRAQVTLHVGAGTFQPVKVEDLAEHPMHREWFELPPATAQAIAATRAAGGRVVAVGTTVLRALESAALVAEGFDVTDPNAWLERPAAPGTPWPLAPGARETALFIRPGYGFRVVDLLVTNFHLPRSTLLMLVSAFAGFEPTRRLYRHAIDGGYRFYSYGDAMLLERAASDNRR